MPCPPEYKFSKHFGPRCHRRVGKAPEGHSRLKAKAEKNVHVQKDKEKAKEGRGCVRASTGRSQEEE